jgi:hypothetical protein
MLTWDPSVADGMSTLGCYNRYYSFIYFYCFGTLKKRFVLQLLSIVLGAVSA